MTTQAPTFSQDIRPKFTQYDRIQMMFFCDLWDHAQVKAHAERICLSLQEDPKQPNTGWSLLPGVHVMPVYGGPWPASWVDTFKAWIAGGCQPGPTPPAPPEPSPWLPLFLSLSKALTGFDDLDSKPDLAQAYLDRLLASATHQSALLALLEAWRGIASLPPAEQAAAIPKQIMTNEAARAVILAWYNAQVDGDQGTPANNQYVYGLVWRALSAHPMGYATENLPFYWRFSPEGSMYTGSAGPAAPWPAAADNLQRVRTR